MIKEIKHFFESTLNKNIPFDKLEVVVSNKKEYITYNFKNIPFYSLTENSQTQSFKEIIAIDGSNKNIFATEEMALSYIKVVAYSSKSDTYEESEFLSMVKAEIEEGAVNYIIKSIHLRGIDLLHNNNWKVDAYDETLSVKAFRAQPSQVSSILRKYAEWKMISHISKKNNNALILKDGSLNASITGEQQFMEEALKNLNNNKLLGIVKNSSLITTKGTNVVWEVSKRFKDKSFWIYGPILKGSLKHPAYIYIANLFPNSRAYRIEMLENSPLIVASLVHDSNDIALPGYPYSLIKADRLCQISNQDVDIIKSSLKSSKNILEYTESIHDIHEEFRNFY